MADSEFSLPLGRLSPEPTVPTIPTTPKLMSCGKCGKILPKDMFFSAKGPSHCTICRNSVEDMSRKEL
ncbi:hypothetical protein MKZ38_006809 [Zalerion maritima]|uniref:Uncharacterized protein n=1 Tax=Zalerion maritima TaxID=339359 RepID=A0AAD5WW60_9PEZI|nr:hypothetical protein MKZ38_006809 [Zalerion maritima]